MKHSEAYEKYREWKKLDLISDIYFTNFLHEKTGSKRILNEQEKIKAIFDIEDIESFWNEFEVKSSYKMISHLLSIEPDFKETFFHDFGLSKNADIEEIKDFLIKIQKEGSLEQLIKDVKSSHVNFVYSKLVQEEGSVFATEYNNYLNTRLMELNIPKPEDTSIANKISLIINENGFNSSSLLLHFTLMKLSKKQEEMPSTLRSTLMSEKRGASMHAGAILVDADMHNLPGRQGMIDFDLSDFISEVLEKPSSAKQVKASDITEASNRAKQYRAQADAHEKELQKLIHQYKKQEMKKVDNELKKITSGFNPEGI